MKKMPQKMSRIEGQVKSIDSTVIDLIKKISISAFLMHQRILRGAKVAAHFAARH